MLSSSRPLTAVSHDARQANTTLTISIFHYSFFFTLNPPFLLFFCFYPFFNFDITIFVVVLGHIYSLLRCYFFFPIVFLFPPISSMTTVSPHYMSMRCRSSTEPQPIVLIELRQCIIIMHIHSPHLTLCKFFLSLHVFLRSSCSS